MSGRYDGSGPAICSTAGIDWRQIEREIPARIVARHRKRTPPMMREGQTVVTDQTVEMGGGVMVYGIVTTCRGGRIVTEFASEGS